MEQNNGRSSFKDEDAVKDKVKCLTRKWIQFNNGGLSSIIQCPQVVE